MFLHTYKVECAYTVTMSVISLWRNRIVITKWYGIESKPAILCGYENREEMIWRRQRHMHLANSIGVFSKYFTRKDIFYKTIANECIICNHDGRGTVILIA